MNLIVLTPNEKVFEGTVKSVIFPGVDGSFEVLNSHAPLIAALKGGVVTLGDATPTTKNEEEGTSTQKEMSFEITGGFVEVLDNNISLVAESIVKEKAQETTKAEG